MSAAISVATDPLREVRVPTASPDDDDGAFALLAIILRALGCDRPPASASDALNARRFNAPNPKYILYDAAPDIVEKQLSFRQKRKMDRAASFTSLASLGVVVDFLQRRIEVQFGGKLHRGTISAFEETYHDVAFDDGSRCWFSLVDHESGHVQQMFRSDEDGAFSEGPKLACRLVDSI